VVQIPAVYHVFLFWVATRTKPLEISPRCQDLVKDIKSSNAAILAVYPDIGPQYIWAN